MTDTITLTGLVATEPKHLTTSEGLAITSFRLASSLRRFDRKTSTWVDAGTNWYTISAFRRLALGAAASISKGDRVIVTGRLRLRDWKNSEKAGMTIEVDADALGHDLNWGTAAYTRTMASGEVQPDPAAGQDPLESSAAPDIEGAVVDAVLPVGEGADFVPAEAQPAETPF